MKRFRFSLASATVVLAGVVLLFTNVVRADRDDDDSPKG
jgi:hypothetical protein